MVKISECAQAEERRKTRLDSPHPAGKTAVCVCVCVWCWHEIFSPVYVANPPTTSALKEGHEHKHTQEREDSDAYIPTGLSGDQWCYCLLKINIEIKLK